MHHFSVERNGLKKIFGLFAAAALAATGLTCCGGGGGDSADGDPANIRKFCGKTLQFNGVGVTGPMAAGTMWVIVDENTYNNSDTTAGAWYSFGENASREMKGQFIVNGGTNAAPVVTIHINEPAMFGQDVNAQGFFADFLPDEVEEGDTVLGTPAPELDMHYTSKTEGVYYVTYTYIDQDAEDDPATLDVDERVVTKKSPRSANFYVLQYQ